VLEVRIAGLSVDATTSQPVLLLVPVGERAESANTRRALPIWIGTPEATAILLAIQNVVPPRPMTHDLMLGAIQATGFQVDRIEVTRLDGGTFYASLVLRNEAQVAVVDARPSDCVALAVRSGCPIFVADEVFSEAAVEVTEVDEEAEVERFRDFLEHVDPADFMS